MIGGLSDAKCSWTNEELSTRTHHDAVIVVAMDSNLAGPERGALHHAFYVTLFLVEWVC